MNAIREIIATAFEMGIPVSKVLISDYHYNKILISCERFLSSRLPSFSSENLTYMGVSLEVDSHIDEGWFEIILEGE